jgi:hypothetical protein
VTDLITVNTDSTAVTVYYFDEEEDRYSITSEF